MSNNDNLKIYKILECSRTDAAHVDYAKLQEGQAEHPVGDPPLNEGDEKMQEWMIKLAMVVKYNLAPKDEKSDYAIRLPEGYELRTKYYKSKNGNKDTPKDKDASKAKAASKAKVPSKGKPEKDTFSWMLYGHGTNPLSPYRSPAEFAPHFLWLLSESTDYKDCPCFNCIQYCKDVAKNNALAVQVATGHMSDCGTEAGSGSDGVRLPKDPSQSARLSRTPSQRQSARASSNAPTPSSSTASERARARRSLGGGSEVFRAGELVWYQHLAWRLGIVREIAYDRVGGEAKFVRIAPLSHASLKAQDVVNPQVMRPFLSFSVPAPSQEFEGKDYEQVNWSQQAQHYMSTPGSNPEQLGLEASKMASRMINWSFSLFNKGPTPSTPGGQQTWGGCFSGAELIFTGDALRVTSAQTEQTNLNDFDVMLLASITKDGAKLKFSGDIYQLTKMAAGSPAPATPAGAVFADEVAIRNKITAAQGITWSWTLVERGGVRDEESTWGRFYVTDKLMRAIDPASFEQAAQKGEVVDAGRFLNYRLQPPVRYIGRKLSRTATLADSVSSAIVLGEEIAEDEGNFAAVMEDLALNV